MPSAKRLVFFDGHCPLCHRFVLLALRLDRLGRLSFAPLQGSTAAARLGGQGGEAEAPESIVYDDGKGQWRRSDAVLRVARDLGGPWALLYGLVVVPRVLRDAVYNWVARHRYGWFGRDEHCRLPAPGEAERFLP